jgi:hypothetical protein
VINDRFYGGNKKEKHDREVQGLLLMDSVLNQTLPFAAKEKIVDFAKVCLYKPIS